MPCEIPRLLLRYMADRQVVPIVGQSLSKVVTSTGSTTVSQTLAETLAKRLGIPSGRLPEGYGLNQVVCAYPDFHFVPSSIYAEIRDVYEESAFTIPPALRKLARIPAFHLYVATSFDGLLRRALEEERCDVETLTYFPKSKVDLPVDAERKRDAVLFEMFGHINSSMDEFTLSEDDLLEFSRALQTDPFRPANLLARLGRSHLLFLGNGFPDWLARFFLRATKDSRIRTSRGKQEFIVDGSVYSDPKLLEFIKYFSRETTVIPTDDVEGFVDALHDAWFESHPEADDTGESTNQDTQWVGEADQTSQAGVFLSYASEDRDSAFCVRESLEKLGWHVWLDQAGGLSAGDAYERKIRKQIQASVLFVPLLSRHTENTLPGQGRFFRREWTWAIERLPDFNGTDWEFIMPLPIDTVDAIVAKVPDVFRQMHWPAPSPGGMLADPLLSTLKERLRRLRRG